MRWLRRIFANGQANNAIEARDLAASAVWGLDKARMILANAQTLHSVEEMKRSITHAMNEIDVVFDEAKRASAQLQGSPEADVE
jgi:hypothetical protein